MGKIQVLDEHIANQIAAGEVVERPASIVKELIENSIDANSTKIEVSVYEGGLSQIKIKDNGEGIAADDIDRAFLRHATSKIKTGKDLFKLRSLGFRGEALPSIAAVSRVTLRTSDNADGHGLEVKLTGGKIVEKKEIAYSQGTEVIIEDVFYNTPARLKYMKSLQTELGHITDYLNRLSLAYPKIAFILFHNDRIILRTHGDGNLVHVISSIYGTGVAKSMIKIEDENLDYQVFGYISKPEITRASKNHISIFVNGRYVRNYLISQAIQRGYKTLLMVNRFPISVLHLTMDPALVDVNVHPAKLEARFSKEQELIKFIEQAVFQVLNKQTFIREPNTPPRTKKAKVEVEQPAFDLSLNVKKSNESSISDKRVFTGELKDNEQKEHHDLEEQLLSSILNNKKSYNSESDNNNRNYELNKEVEPAIDRVREQAVPNVEEEQEFNRFPLLDPVAQIQGTYIVAQSEKGLYLIDQHAAHERIRYEKNMDFMHQEELASQELLIPLTIDYTLAEAEQLNQHLEEFEKYGIGIEPFGNQTFIVRSIPQWVPKDKENEFIDRMSDMILKENKINLEELRDDLIASASCKSAIKANKYLTKQEMEVLLEQLRNTKNPYSCPHGRPIIIHFSFNEIEKMFKRVV